MASLVLNGDVLALVHLSVDFILDCCSCSSASVFYVCVLFFVCVLSNTSCI